MTIICAYCHRQKSVAREMARDSRRLRRDNVIVSWRFAAAVETRHVREVGPLTHNILVLTPSVQRECGCIVIPSRDAGTLSAHLQRWFVSRELGRVAIASLHESRFVKSHGNLSSNFSLLLLRIYRSVLLLLLRMNYRVFIFWFFWLICRLQILLIR